MLKDSPEKRINVVCYFYFLNFLAAVECLKKKQLYQKQLELNDGALMKLQAQRNALDSALMNKNILDTMKTVNSAMRNIHKDMYAILFLFDQLILCRNVDKVHDLMDDVNEQQEIANEIANAISMPTGFSQYDDEELLQELEMLTVIFYTSWRKFYVHYYGLYIRNFLD